MTTSSEEVEDWSQTIHTKYARERTQEKELEELGEQLKGVIASLESTGSSPNQSPEEKDKLQAAVAACQEEVARRRDLVNKVSHMCGCRACHRD